MDFAFHPKHSMCLGKKELCSKPDAPGTEVHTATPEYLLRRKCWVKDGQHFRRWKKLGKVKNNMKCVMLFCPKTVESHEEDWLGVPRVEEIEKVCIGSLVPLVVLEPSCVPAVTRARRFSAYCLHEQSSTRSWGSSCQGEQLLVVVGQSFATAFPHSRGFDGQECRGVRHHGGDERGLSRRRVTIRL